MRRMHKSPVQDSNESSEECIHSLKSRANTDHLTEAPKQEEEDFVSREESTGLLPQSDKDIMAKERWYSTRTRVLFITHFNVFLYATCFWIQIGVLPYLTKRLGVNPVVFGYLQTTFAVVQLCGGPFYGRFGDIFGGKAALLLAFIASSTAYSLLAISDSIPLLFLSRIPSIGMHSMQGSQMVITDASDHASRADALGKLGISYGLGMIVGPFLGGLITSASSEETAAATAAVGSLISAALVLLFIPSNTKELLTADTKKQREDDDKPKEDASVFNLKRILRILGISNVAYLLAIKCICGVPFGIFQSMFSIVAMDYFKLDPKENGFVLSYAGILGILSNVAKSNPDLLAWAKCLSGGDSWRGAVTSAIVVVVALLVGVLLFSIIVYGCLTSNVKLTPLIQGIGVGLLTKRFKDTTLLNWSVLIIAIAYLLMIGVTNIITFCLMLIPLVTGGSILQVIITSSLTKMVPAHETGAAIGLSMATHSLIRSISPTVGGYLFNYFGFIVFGITGLIINGPLAFYLLMYGRKEF